MKEKCMKLAHLPDGMQPQTTDAGNEPAQIEELFDPATSRHYEIKSLRRDVMVNSAGWFTSLEM